MTHHGNDAEHEHGEHNPGEPQFGEGHGGEHNPGEPKFPEDAKSDHEPADAGEAADLAEGLS